MASGRLPRDAIGSGSVGNNWAENLVFQSPYATPRNAADYGFVFYGFLFYNGIAANLIA